MAICASTAGIDMTQDEIIEMAIQAGIKRRTDEFYSEFCDGVYFDDLEDFAKLVADKATEEANARANASWTLMCEKMVAFEREAIKKLFEELSNNTEPHKDYEDYDDGWVDACNACKWAVTKRGEA
jgi:hypothetical protein